MNYKLRNCTLKDLDFLLELKRLGIKWYVDKLYGWDDEVQKQILLNQMKDKLDFMKVIVVNGRDVGISIFCEYDEYYEVDLIIIHPDFQNKGIAGAVLRQHIKTAQDNKKRIIIKTYKENPAQKLYVRVGFNVYKTDDTHIYLDINFNN